jgi:hypothetical protein
MIVALIADSLPRPTGREHCPAIQAPSALKTPASVLCALRQLLATAQQILSVTGDNHRLSRAALPLATALRAVRGFLKIT